MSHPDETTEPRHPSQTEVQLRRDVSIRLEGSVEARGKAAIWRASLRLLQRVLRRRPAIGQTAPLERGRFSYGVPAVHHYLDGATVTIGSFCSIAVDVEIIPGGNHRTDWVSTYPFNTAFAAGKPDADGAYSKGPVLIGNDVWIGRGAKILSGVTIGHGSVIGAYSVVAADVRPYAVVAGNPAREVRRRLPDADVERLLEIEWWDWPIQDILAAIGLLCSNNLDDFYEFTERRSLASSAVAAVDLANNPGPS